MTEDLAMKRVSAKFVPKLLTAEQKQLRVELYFTTYNRVKGMACSMAELGSESAVSF